MVRFCRTPDGLTGGGGRTRTAGPAWVGRERVVSLRDVYTGEVGYAGSEAEAAYDREPTRFSPATTHSEFATPLASGWEPEHRDEAARLAANPSTVPPGSGGAAARGLSGTPRHSADPG